ncbi:MAG: GNAT family N-acetyltransferase [Vicinamibacterales bacterium]
MISTEFRDPGTLLDGELHLRLRERFPGDAARAWVPAYRFDLVVAGEVAGDIEFRLGATPAMVNVGGQIAYGVRPAHRGHHFASRSLRLLLPLARAHGMTELWITCNPDNWASRRTCELAGAELVETVDLPPDSDMYLEGERRKCRYRVALRADA